MFEAVPIDQGDLRWVFPDAQDDLPIRDALFRVSAKIEKLADSFGVRAGETGRGLEYTKVSGVPLAGVFGRVEVSDVTFRADLYFERHSALEQRWGPPWKVSSIIEVRGSEDPSVVIEEMSEIVDSETVALALFEAQVDWLIARGAEVDLDYWKAQADEQPPSPA
jgi:uncharacterized coiled-coil protein SlyX